MPQGGTTSERSVGRGASLAIRSRGAIPVSYLMSGVFTVVTVKTLPSSWAAPLATSSPPRRRTARLMLLRIGTGQSRHDQALFHLTIECDMLREEDPNWEVP